MAEAVVADRLRQIVVRIERLDDEIKALNQDKSEVYGEAKGAGFDVRTIKAVIRDRRLDRAEKQERDALYDVYWAALHGPSYAGDDTGTPVASRVRAQDQIGAGDAANPSPAPATAGSPVPPEPAVAPVFVEPTEIAVGGDVEPMRSPEPSAEIPYPDPDPEPASRPHPDDSVVGLAASANDDPLYIPPFLRAR